MTPNMPKSRTSAILSLLFVFASGAVLGAVGTRLYTVKTVSSQSPSAQPPHRPDPEEIRKHLVNEAKEKMRLDDDQMKRLNQIYDQTREDMDEIHHKANAEVRMLWDKQNNSIRALLRPDQIPAYEQLRAEREARRKAREKNGPGGPGGPPPSKP